MLKNSYVATFDSNSAETWDHKFSQFAKINGAFRHFPFDFAFPNKILLSNKTKPWGSVNLLLQFYNPLAIFSKKSMIGGEGRGA